MAASRGGEWPPAAMTSRPGGRHRGLMINTIARAMGAAVTMPWRALAAVLAVRTFGHDWDYPLPDDYELLDEVFHPNASPLLTRENGSSSAVNWKRC